MFSLHGWRRAILIAVSILLFTLSAAAGILGTVRGIAHDPQHRPIRGAAVMLKAAHSDFMQHTTTKDDGSFEFPAVELGEYIVTVSAEGFTTQEQRLQLASDAAPILHFPMSLATVTQQINVSGAAPLIDPASNSTLTEVDRERIADTPGASRTNSLAFITDYIPGAAMVHNQLHVRGGHQSTWAIDGVALPNTNIASNVGPQFDPKDIDTVEIQRGGLASDYGDRAYGVFNVAQRSGFERNREAELLLSYGTFNATDDQLNFGDHTQNFAYYVSLNGNRTDYGLEPPVEKNIHNIGDGAGLSSMLTYNVDPNDQLRFSGGFRSDFYQVPVDPTA